MTKRTLFIAAACLGAMLLTTSATEAHIVRYRHPFATYDSQWQPTYYDVAWGMPQALVIPPTAHTQSSYSWSVSGTSRSGFPQYGPMNPGPQSVYNPRAYAPAPAMPMSTEQMGDYSVRGPR
jgi:hypothetical protein